MSNSEPTHFDPPVTDIPVSFDPTADRIQAEVISAPTEVKPPQRRVRRRVVLPLVLFLLTCLSTFFVGATNWRPDEFLWWGIPGNPTRWMGDPFLLLAARRAVLTNWQQGLTYMACLLGILMMHEMGHFVMTLIHRVRASLPFFVPLPITPIGTMGAVIAMDGSRADRRQIFDIGLAGPLAGLVIATPIVWLGAMNLDLKGPATEGLSLELPWAMRMAVDYLQPGAYDPAMGVPLSRVNAYFMAGWVGLLVTALNMLPVSQLDGGHVAYALFGRYAHWFARVFMFLAMLYMSISVMVFRTTPGWILMAVLVLAMGVDHPPTRDDTVKLGWFRTVLGAVSLLIPLFCFVPNPVRLLD